MRKIKIACIVLLTVIVGFTYISNISIDKILPIVTTSNNSTRASGAGNVRGSSLVDELADFFQQKMSNAKEEKVPPTSSCHTPNGLSNSCDNNNCLRFDFPTNLKERIAQVVNPTTLQIPPQVNQVLDGMARKVSGGHFDFMILSAASSNHFLEAQTFIRDVHRYVFPNFKNVSLVFYNLGLTRSERQQLVKFCKCQVMDFPFDLLPDFIRQLKCYSWKPIIIRAHARQANVVFWADSSIRFYKDPKFLSSLIQRTKERGIQITHSLSNAPFRTYRSMYHYFGDEPCMHDQTVQVEAGLAFYNNDFLVRRAILDPYAACAVTKSCICPLQHAILACGKGLSAEKAWAEKRGPAKYGLCHRFDQSAVTLILHKIYRGYFKWLTFNERDFLKISRGDRFAYFASLKKGSA